VFPSYPSNYGSAANRGAAVLRRLYGDAGYSITLSNPAVPNIVLQYASFKQITEDVSDARAYGRIHYRTDRWQELAWAGLTAEQSTNTICVLCTIMTATMMMTE
jgi:hypothetical protein